MTSFLQAFHFLRPWWLLLALGWVPLVYFVLREDLHGAKLRRLVDATLLPHLLVRSGKSRHGSVWLLSAVGLLVTLALAGPAWQRLPQPLYGGGAAQVVVVSLSQRMLARDVTPDRMQRVRYKVHDLLQANKDGRNALVAYAGAAFVVAPLTTDAHALSDLLDALSPKVMPAKGDAPASGIRQGVKLLRQAGAQDGSLVLVTDRVDKAAVVVARKAHAEGVRVSVLGVGGSSGVPVKLPNGSLLTDADGHIVMTRQDAKSLKALADAGGGIYVPMRDNSADIVALKAELRADHQPVSNALAKADQWRDMGPWLLLPVLLLVALAFRRGWLLVLLLVLLPCTSPVVFAADAVPVAGRVVQGEPVTADKSTSSWHDRWSSLWLNADQRATRALAEGHPKEAQHLARTPVLRGAAAYQAGDYAEAARAFAQAPGANAAYNLGNALAREGHYRRAIKAYDKALKQDAGLADARVNRKAVEDWLRQHEHKSGTQSPRSGKAHANKPQKQGKSASGSGHHGQSSGDSHHGSQAGKPSGGREKSASGHAPHPAHAGSSNSAPSPAPTNSRPAPANAASAGHRKDAQQAPDARKAQKQQAEARAARKALQQLGSHRSGHRQGFDLGNVPAPATSAKPLPAPMQRALQRVQDDPGGLLQRKFELEYQEREGARDGGGS